LKIRRLSLLAKEGPREIEIAKLPRDVSITTYAKCRALAVNGLVRAIHGDSYEWYGFTLALKDRPECIVDIGIPFNDSNAYHHTAIGPENISLFSDSLPHDLIINGWIHSHGRLDYRGFSRTDEQNHLSVLDYVGTFVKKPVSRRQIVIRDLVALTQDRFGQDEKTGRSVWVVTDVPVSEARIFEAVHGSFCYGIVVGDGGWHMQEIYYKTRGILTGTVSIGKKEARMVPVDSGRVFTKKDRELLAGEIKAKIKPGERISHSR
jgi:hypothetical protein